MNKVAAFALRRKNSILSMSEKMFCPPQPLRFWITPAYAGKSCRAVSLKPSSRDHPRVCGEKFALRNMMNVNQGSSPRMRGKGGRTGSSGRYTGITPACAGKSGTRLHQQAPERDHPRVCGEKSCFGYSGFRAWGSPPRVRGKALDFGVFPFQKGITPAYAGKRITVRQRPVGSWDHPRACGEKHV